MELFYKKDQGVRSRWTMGLSVLALGTFAAFQLFDTLPSDWRQPLGGGVGTMLGTDFPISWAFILATLLFGATVVGALWLCNYPKFVDFLIGTETELNKVSWWSKQEVIGASIVVVVTTFILGAYMALVDVIIIQVFQKPKFWSTVWKTLGLQG